MEHLYIYNKINYRQLCQYNGSLGQHGGSYKIIKEIGKGQTGQAYLIKMNNKKYILKKQGISETNYNNDTTKNPINRELIFYEWINKLNKKKQKFFVKLYSYKKYVCDFDFIPIRSDEKITNKYCVEYIIGYKDGTLDDILFKTSLQKQIISYFVQTLYALYMMAKANYYHMDAKLDNITYKKTNKKYIILETFGKIKSYGKHISLIDYGNIYSATFEQNTFEQKHFNKLMLNSDLYLLIDYFLLNMANVCGQIEIQKIAIRTKELFDIIRIIKYSNEYKKVTNFINDELKITEIS